MPKARDVFCLKRLLCRILTRAATWSCLAGYVSGLTAAALIIRKVSFMAKDRLKSLVSNRVPFFFRSIMYLARPVGSFD